MARIEITLPLIVALIISAGFVILSSAAPNLSFVSRQAVFLGLALLVSFIILLTGRKRIMAVAFPLYALSIILLILTQLFGREVNGAKSWLYLGPLPGFQPSELAKITLILSMAKLLHEKPIKHLFDYIKPVILLLLPFSLVFFRA